MPLFFIEMNQGLIARGDFRVCTSALYTCTFIAGYNAQSGYAGAFHYPADALKRDPQVVADMNIWAAILRPTQLVMVHGKNVVGLGHGPSGTSIKDKARLLLWAQTKCGVQPTTMNGSVGGMFMSTLLGFGAGKPNNLAVAGYNKGSAVEVDKRMPGRYLDHGGFTLVGTA